MLTDTSKTGQPWWSPNALCRQSTTGVYTSKRYLRRITAIVSVASWHPRSAGPAPTCSLTSAVTGGPRPSGRGCSPRTSSDADLADVTMDADGLRAGAEPRPTPDHAQRLSWNGHFGPIEPWRQGPTVIQS